MKEFYSDVYARKNLAGQSKHRKRGSKSKKCTLPSDGLTNKQWKERCGQIMVYNNNKPMDWKIFKQLAKVSQEEYLQGLQSKYGATAKDIATMFGLNPVSVRRYVEEHKLNVTFPRGVKQKTREQKDAWESFLSGDFSETNKQPEYEAFEPFSVQEEPQISSNCPINDTDSYACNPTQVVMSQFSVCFQGKMDIDMIANSLRQILGDCSVGKIQISYECT